MKKLLLCAVVAIATLAIVSCEKGAERVQVVGDIFTEAVTGDDGTVAYKLMATTDGATYPVADELFTKVVYNQDAKLILAYSGKIFSCYNSEGNKRGAGGYDGIEIKSDHAVLKSGDDLTLYFFGEDKIFATFKDYLIVGDKIFTKGVKGWGLYNMKQDYLQEMIYEKLYILNQKNAKEYDVLRCHKGKWEMVSSDDAVYDAASVNDAVGLMKKMGPAADAGVLNINF